MLKTTPLLKGLITGALMIASMLILGNMGVSADSGAGYIVHILYGAGVGWAIYDYSKSPAFTGKFGGMFNIGFRCFIIVTLMMVVYAFLFYTTHPEIKEEMVSKMTQDLQAQKEFTADQIAEKVDGFKKGFSTTIVSLTVFQNLLLGALFTAAWSIFVLILNKRSTGFSGQTNS